MPNKEIWMQRAFDLALLGSGRVAPNPLVGCVLVNNDRIISEGYHQQYGGHMQKLMPFFLVPNQLLARQPL